LLTNELLRQRVPTAQVALHEKVMI
jgi:hypothetical protein